MGDLLTSVEIHSRKRKKRFASVLTRSKTRMFSHQDRSGFSGPDSVSTKFVPQMESLESFLGGKCRGTSRVFLTKDLGHKRIFTPGVHSFSEEENEDENGERKKLLKGFGLSTDPDDVKEARLEESGFVRSEVENESTDGANGLKEQEIPGNGSLLKNNMSLNGSRRRKVFKTPSSFSYRRLLPHLMEIVNDTSSVSEIEIVDAGNPYKIPKLDDVNLKTRSIAENRYAAKIDCVAPQFSNLNSSENPDLGEVHVELFSVQPDLSTVDKDVEEKGHENDVKGIDASVEEHIQTTPPDISLFAKVEDRYVGESVDANKVLANHGTFVGLPVDREKNSNGAMKQSPNTVPNSTNETVLNPCSRLKLFKNPRSLSYRRLLPYLMDISKNSSYSSRKPQQQMHHVVSEDKHQTSALDVQDNVNSTARQNYEEKCSEDLLQMTPLLPDSDGSSPDSNNNLVSSISESPATNYSSSVCPSFIDFGTLPDPGMLKGLLTEEIPQTQNNPTKLQIDLGSKAPSSMLLERTSNVNNGILTQLCTSEEPKSVEKHKMCSSVGLELNNGNAELVNLEQLSLQNQAADALVSPSNRPTKGILKRNRRGCKGLCNCLNCASFRLHAERSFEFSRIQLHDAGEVASELMKELANLRLLLQKSISENKDCSSIRPHPVLIEQACNKALEAETLAKERLDELNDELRIHCRTPPVLLQPKVTFACNT